MHGLGGNLDGAENVNCLELFQRVLGQDFTVESDCEFPTPPPDVGTGMLDHDDLTLVTRRAWRFFIFRRIWQQSGPVGRLIGQANGVGRTLEATRIIPQRRRANPGRGHCPRLAESLQGAGKQCCGERHRHPFFLRCVVNRRAVDFDSLLPQQERIRRQLRRIIVFGDEVSILISARRTAFVIEQLPPVSGILDEIHNASEPERLGMHRH